MENIYEETVNTEKQITFYRPAGFGIRFFAYVIDLIVIASITTIVIARFITITADSFYGLLGLNLGTVGIIGSLYFLLMTKFFGQTIGKMIAGIEVIRTDGETPDWLSLLFREVIGRLISQLGGLHPGYIWVAFHPRKQGWHDSLGDSYVVYKKENTAANYIEID